MAHDDEFLREALKNTIIVDEFTRKLHDIYDEVQRSGGPVQVGNILPNNLPCIFCTTLNMDEWIVGQKRRR